MDKREARSEHVPREVYRVPAMIAPESPEITETGGTDDDNDVIKEREKQETIEKEGGGICNRIERLSENDRRRRRRRHASQDDVIRGITERIRERIGEDRRG